MAKQHDTKLINPSGTVVTLTEDADAFDPFHHVLSTAVEQELRDAGYVDLEDGEDVPPQHWEADTAAQAAQSFADRAAPAPAAMAIDDAAPAGDGA